MGAVVITITPEDYKAILQPTGNGKRPRRKRSRNPDHISESLIVKTCIDWLWKHGVYCWRNNTGMLRDASDRPVRYGLVGSPDIIGITPSGRFIGVECKSPTGKCELTEPQERFKARCQEHNGLYIMATGADTLEAAKTEILA